jgi:hypothetical protein
MGIGYDTYWIHKYVISTKTTIQGYGYNIFNKNKNIIANCRFAVS